MSRFVHSPRHHVLIGSIGLTGLMALAAPVSAEPLPRDASGSEEARVEHRWRDPDIALSDPRLEPPEPSSGGIQGSLLSPPGAGRSQLGNSQSFDFGQVARPSGGGSMQDMLRSFITVRRGTPTTTGGPPPRGSKRAPDDSLGLDLGLSSNEWLLDSVQGVATSVLSLNVNERGEASFSVLGLGDFSVIFSGDRSEVALQAGDEVLTTARRAAYPGSGGSAEGGVQESSADGSAVAPASLLRQVFEFVIEIASHPLSFIVYALIGAYVVVWAVLSSRSRRPRHTRAPLHGPARHATASAHAFAYARPAAAPAAPAPKKVRKRMRLRVRMRKYR